MKSRWPNHFRVKIEIGSETPKSYPDDIFRLSILYIIHPVGEALEHKDVEEPRDLAREYVIISVDKIYMFIFVDFKLAYTKFD